MRMAGRKLDANWETIHDEALQLIALQKIRAAEKMTMPASIRFSNTDGSGFIGNGMTPAIRRLSAFVQGR